MNGASNNLGLQTCAAVAAPQVRTGLAGQMFGPNPRRSRHPRGRPPECAGVRNAKPTKTFDSLPAQADGEKPQRLLEIKRWYAKCERQVSFLCPLAQFLLFFAVAK